MNLVSSSKTYSFSGEARSGRKPVEGGSIDRNAMACTKRVDSVAQGGDHIHLLSVARFVIEMRDEMAENIFMMRWFNPSVTMLHR